MMLKRIDEPSRLLVRVRFLNPPGEHPIVVLEKKSRSQMLLTLNVFPIQMTAWLRDLFQGLQYSVLFQEDRAVAIVEGASVGGLLMQLQGTYQVAGDHGMERLLLIEAKAIEDSVQLEDRGACDRETEQFTNQADGFPNSEYCGRDGWSIIRGQFDDWIQDFRTAGRLPTLTHGGKANERADNTWLQVLAYQCQSIDCRHAIFGAVAREIGTHDCGVERSAGCFDCGESS